MALTVEPSATLATPDTVRAPAAPSPAPAPGWQRRDALALTVGALVLYALNVDFLMRGDASMYADYVLLGKFDELTLHVGYYALVWAADRALGAPLGVPVHETMVWLDVIAGALTIGIAHRLAAHLFGRRAEAVATAVLLALCGRVIMNATTSEIYMVQTTLVLASFLLFVEERVATAGVAAGAALLVSPLSALCFLFFPVFDYERAGRVRLAVWLRLAAGALVVYLPFLAVAGRELFWGRRGLLTMNQGLPSSPATMLANFPRFQFKHYTSLLLLLLPALLVVRAHRRLLAVTLAVVLPHLYVIARLTEEDMVFVLTTDFFFACWLAAGWRVLAQRAATRIVAVLLVAGHVASYVGSGALFHFEPHRGYAAELRDIAREHLVGRDAVMISDWDVGMSLTFFGRPSVTTTIERDPLYRQQFDLTEEYADRSLLEAAELYLLDPWSPSPLNRWFRSEAQLAQLAEERSIAKRAERELGLSCRLQRRGTHPLYRCHRAEPESG